MVDYTKSSGHHAGRIATKRTWEKCLIAASIRRLKKNMGDEPPQEHDNSGINPTKAFMRLAFGPSI